MDESNKSRGQPEVLQRFMFRLYVTGGGPNSALARANLLAIGRDVLAGQYDLEVVDLLEEPQRALRDGIIVTPTLVKLSPGPRQHITGNLRDTATVLLALGLETETS